jgi:hypothetical protein
MIFVAKTVYRKGQDCICLVVIHHKEADVALERLEGKQPSVVVVQHPRVFVSKCSKEKYFGLAWTIVIVNDVGRTMWQ